MITTCGNYDVLMLFKAGVRRTQHAAQVLSACPRSQVLSACPRSLRLGLHRGWLGLGRGYAGAWCTRSWGGSGGLPWRRVPGTSLAGPTRTNAR